MSSSSSNYASHSDSDESCQSSVVQKYPTVKPKCRILVKGGDVDDYGATYNIPYDTPLHNIFVDYARKVGVTVRDVKLKYNTHFISPDATPFSLEFEGNEVLLAYGEDQVSPLPVRFNHHATRELLVFNIVDVMDQPVKERFLRSKHYHLRDLYKEWRDRRGVPGGDVTFFLKGDDLDQFVEREGVTLAQAGIYDGALLYAKYLKYD